mgnify:CR=1 FL=1|jgi:hypothetical protein
MEGGEIITITPSKPSKQAIIPIQPQRNCACTLRVQVSDLHGISMLYCSWFYSDNVVFLLCSLMCRCEDSIRICMCLKRW